MTSKLDLYLSDNSSQEDLDYALEQAEDALGTAIRNTKGYTDQLVDLLVDVVGSTEASARIVAILDNCDPELVIEWHKRGE